MTVKLIRIDRNIPKEEVVLDQFPVVIGRAEHASVRIDSHLVSRLHCQIVCEDDRLLVRDLGSTMGTLVNLQDVQETELCHGDLLTIGPFTYRVVHPGHSVFGSVRRLWRQLVHLFHRRTPAKRQEPLATSSASISGAIESNSAPNHSQLA